MAESSGAIYGEAYPIDEDFLAALAIMPAASGAALGFDRLVMLRLRRRADRRRAMDAGVRSRGGAMNEAPRAHAPKRGDALDRDLWLRRLPPRTGGNPRRRARRRGRARRDADRRRQVAVLPVAGAGARRPDAGRLAADRADARPGRPARRARHSRRGASTPPPARRAPPRRRRPARPLAAAALCRARDGCCATTRSKR